MKNVLFILLICPILLSSKSKDDCQRFKTGKFIYLDESLKGVIIIRDNNIQTEKDSKSKITIKGKVKWINSCEYHILITEDNSPYSNKMIGKTIVSRISSIKGDTFNVHSKMDTLSLKLTMVKIN